MMIVVAYLWKEEKALRTSRSKAHKRKDFFFEKWKFKKSFFESMLFCFESRSHGFRGSGYFENRKKCQKNVFTIPTKGFLIHWRVVSIDLDTKQSYIFLQNESKQNFVFFWIFFVCGFRWQGKLERFLTRWRHCKFEHVFQRDVITCRPIKQQQQNGENQKF